MRKPRLAAVSPFIDKRHGTERCLAEQLERLADDYEIHVYTQRVEDLDLSKLRCHRIPRIPGAHLINYIWWFAANHVWRWWDARFRGQPFALVYSPGINCLDADVVSVHMVFAELYRQVKSALRLRNNPLLSWPRTLHRRAYYRLIMALERRVYPKPRIRIAAISRQVAAHLVHHFGRTDHVEVVYDSVDSGIFQPQTRLARRAEMRERFGLRDTDFVLLLIGNGWRNKGLPGLLEAMAELPGTTKLLVVGEDDRAPYQAIARQLRVADRVAFLEPSADVLQFYAACDLYVGPSIYDPFALPLAEAMACGLPIIASRNTGASEIITPGEDGLILEDPSDSRQLAQLVRRLREDPELRRRLGENAVRTAQQYNWERNAAGIRALLEQARRDRNGA